MRVYHIQNKNEEITGTNNTNTRLGLHSIMTDIYTTLTFKNHEEFEMYKNALDRQSVFFRVSLDNRNITRAANYDTACITLL